MLELVYGPSWFVFWGIFIDLLSALILSMVAFRMLKYSGIDKHRKSRWVRFASGFALISIGLYSRVAMIGAMASEGLMASEGGVYGLGFLNPTIKIIIFAIVALIAQFSLLYGLYIIYGFQRKHGLGEHTLIAFLLGMIIFFGTDSYYVFHLISLVLSLLVTSLYINLYKKKKHAVRKLIAYCFGLFSAASFLFILVSLNPILYVAAELIWLIGSLILAGGLFMVFQHGKKITA